jgi:hypothetical protein
MIQSGGESINKYLTILREALLVKDGIVPEEFKASFRLSIEMYLNEDFMDTMGDDYSTF